MDIVGSLGYRVQSWISCAVYIVCSLYSMLLNIACSLYHIQSWKSYLLDTVYSLGYWLPNAVLNIVCSKRFYFLLGKWFYVKSNYTHDSATRYWKYSWSSNPRGNIFFRLCLLISSIWQCLQECFKLQLSLKMVSITHGLVQSSRKNIITTSAYVSLRSLLLFLSKYLATEFFKFAEDKIMSKVNIHCIRYCNFT